MTRETIHASTVAVGGRAVLIAGPSGTGKSDLALRLIDRGAILVADDYTDLVAEAGVLRASPPATIAGKIEVRGIGIVDMAHVAAVPVALAVRLDSEPRMPDPAQRRIAGITIPEVVIAPFAASAPLKVELALARVPE